MIGLFDAPEEPRAHARRSDPETSHAAAASVRNLTANAKAVWTVLSIHGPLSDQALIERYQELASRSNLPRQSVSGIRTRRRELVDAGRVRWTGTFTTTWSRRAARVWAAVPPDEWRADDDGSLPTRPRSERGPVPPVGAHEAGPWGGGGEAGHPG